MKSKPNGVDLLELLIRLYADQEGVEITYEITDGGEENKAGSAKAS